MEIQDHNYWASTSDQNNARVKLCVIGKEIKAIAQGLAKLI